MLEARNVVKRYDVDRGRGKSDPFVALDSVSALVEPGGSLGIVGESGSGKTTLARVLLGLIEPDAGIATFDGASISSLSTKERRQYRRSVQPVFQDPRSSINARRSVEDAITEPLIYLTPEMSREERRDRVEEVCGLVALQTSVLGQMPAELSGGMLQRVAVARALAPRPQILVCDEPVSALDVSVKAGIVNLLLRLKQEYDLGMLYISHDALLVRHLCDRVMIMDKGRVVAEYTSEETYSATSSSQTYFGREVRRR